MNEDSGVEKARRNVPNLQFILGDGQVKVNVSAIADSLEEVVKLAKSVLDDWLALNEGKDHVAQIAQLRPIVVSEQATVAEHGPRDAVGVARDRDVHGAVDEIGGIVQIVPTEDLLSVSRVIMQELSRRSGSEYGDPTVSELLEVDAQVTRTPRPTGTSGVGDSVTNN